MNQVMIDKVRHGLATIESKEDLTTWDRVVIKACEDAIWSLECFLKSDIDEVARRFERASLLLVAVPCVECGRNPAERIADEVGMGMGLCLPCASKRKDGFDVAWENLHERIRQHGIPTGKHKDVQVEDGGGNIVQRVIVNIGRTGPTQAHIYRIPTKDGGFFHIQPKTGSFVKDKWEATKAVYREWGLFVVDEIVVKPYCEA